MREFLSQNSVEFEERNIAKEARWRADVKKLTGEIVVPVLLVDGDCVIGLDEDRIAAAVGLRSARSDSNRDGLSAPAGLTSLPEHFADSTAESLAHFVRRLQREMEFNDRKTGSPYRDGQHDGMRFARDAILRILNGTYEREEMVIDRGETSA